MFYETYKGIYSWGLEVIKAMQSIATPGLNAFVAAFTNIGGVYFYLLAMCILYWCFDEKRGFKITYIMLLSTGVNLIVKDILKVLRPYQIDPSVKVVEESEYSTPSGHAQSTACFWPLFMFGYSKEFGKKWKTWAWILTFFMPVLIGVTRPFLGVHYPTDVFLGWALGALFALIGLFVAPKAGEFVKKLPQSPKILACAILPFLMLLMNKTITTIPGMLFGIGVGYVYLGNLGGFCAKQGSWWQKLLRLVIGAGGAGLLMVLFKMPVKTSEYYNLLHFAKYALIGVWCALGAPLVFILLKIAQKAPAAAAENTEKEE